ncbi:MAG: MFS transporter [Prevotella sp.]|nr:MFS transporter [Prevotella sp.]
MKKSLIALALGTLALGITEFVMMGILPDVAASLGVSIPEAGRLISAYAIGVCCGAPMLTVAHKYPPKNILLFLGVLMLTGAVLSVIAQNYYLLLIARFISGLPHGAYFGVASIVAVRLADEGHKTGAVSIMIAGMTVANLLGVPLGTALSSAISWRCPFVLVIFCSLLVIYYLWKWVPFVEPLPDNGFRSQFSFLRAGAPWLILGATMLGNGSIFCWYSYVTPQLINEGGFSPNVISMLMIAAGFGMVVGNLISGRLSDQYGPGHVARFTLMVTVVSLLLTFVFAQYGWFSAALMVVCTGCLFSVSSPLQFLILKHAPGGEMLGGASIQMAFNLGNAVGALLGGLPIEMGLGYRYPALFGAPLALCGLVCLLVFCRKYERTE